MFSIEMRINGTLTHVIHGRNVRNYDLSDYEYRLTEVDTGRTVQGEVSHRRTDGLPSLAAMIIADASQTSVYRSPDGSEN